MTAAKIRRYVGIVLGALALYLTCRDLAIDDLRAGVGRLTAPLVAAVLSSVLLTIAAVALRWRFILGLGGIAASWRAVTVAVLLGQAGNIVFPFRTGEAARVYIIANASRRSLMDVAATVIVERMFDVGMLAALSLALLLAHALPVPLALTRLLITLLLLTIAAAAVATIASRRAGGRPFRSPPIQRVLALIEPAAQWLRRLHGWWPASALTLLTVLTFFCAAATNGLLFIAFGFPVPAVAAIVVLIALQVGTTVASVPGNLGVFQYVTVLVLVRYGIGRAEAVTYAWSLYGFTVLPRVLAGAALMMSGHWSVPDQGGSVSSR